MKTLASVDKRSASISTPTLLLPPHLRGRVYSLKRGAAPLHGSVMINLCSASARFTWFVLLKSRNWLLVLWTLAFRLQSQPLISCHPLFDALNPRFDSISSMQFSLLSISTCIIKSGFIMALLPYGTSDWSGLQYSVVPNQETWVMLA